MNQINKIEYLRKVERKLMRIAKYSLIGIGCDFLFVIFAGLFGWMKASGIAGLIAAMFPWIFVVFASIICLVVIIATLIKYAISILFYSFNDRKNGADNLFVALLATLFLLFLIPMLLMAVAPTPGRSKARDARRMSDMRQLASAQELYFSTNSLYLSARSIPDAINYYSTTTSEIKTFITPMDPEGGNVIPCEKEFPAFIYCGIDNTSNPARFCYYARLENGKKSGKEIFPYYVVSPSGIEYREKAPRTMDDCNNKP